MNNIITRSNATVFSGGRVRIILAVFFSAADNARTRITLRLVRQSSTK